MSTHIGCTDYKLSTAGPRHLMLSCLPVIGGNVFSLIHLSENRNK